MAGEGGMFCLGVKVWVGKLFGLREMSLAPDCLKQSSETVKG